MATTWKLESASKITKHTQKTGLKKNNKINHVLTDKRLQHLEWKKKKKSECYLESNGNKNVYVVGKKKKTCTLLVHKHIKLIDYTQTKSAIHALITNSTNHRTGKEHT